MLIMSATPIPRTLALILYGKTDISAVDELPPGRKPVKTHIVPPAKRKSMYEYIKNETAKGGQAFVVCPLIEKNEDVDARSAEEIYEELKSIFDEGTIALLHGRMKPAEKESTVESFRKGEIRALVSTTVIEVGVNVPAATIMVVENAERFGLAQLHQLRGRVGRGDQASYCFLTTNGKENERLQILAQTADGFEIAQKDLMLRGPGEFLGSRQNGVGDLYMAHLIRDVNIIKEAQNIYEALETAGDIKALSIIKEAAVQKFAGRFEEISMN
jgi:ATP-dependent DNA helicase RecG